MAKETPFDAAIEKRQSVLKTKFIETLRELPIIQFACNKSSVSRSTYYRWYKKDKKFARESDEAIEQGRHYINDMGESQLIQLIKEKKMPAIAMWLKHNSPRYRPQPMWRQQEPPRSHCYWKLCKK